MLHSQHFAALLVLFNKRFAKVAIDTPPVGAVSDALVIGPQIDGAVLVVRAHRTLRASAAAVLQQLRAIRIRIAGAVLNDVDLRKEGGSSYYYAGAYEYAPSKDAA